MDVTSTWRSSPTSAERLAVARIIGAKGLEGGVHLEMLTDRQDRLDEGVVLWVEDEATPRRVVSVERGGRVPVAFLEGILDRASAEALTGRFLEVVAAPLPPDIYYWHELEGLVVRDESGQELGTLVEVFRAGGAEVYRVVGEAGERLVPALRRIVRTIDLEAGIMVVRPDDGEEIR